MISTPSPSAALRRFIDEDALGQLRQRTGTMAALGSSGGALKLDWVDGVQRMLDAPGALEEVEEEARALWRRGIRHIMWAGMGGSIITVRVLTHLSIGWPSDLSVHPLDSTDPAALNAIVATLVRDKGLVLPDADQPASPALLHALFHDVLMVGVAMGMTSEEPITHLEWFTDLLIQAGLPVSDHILVTSLPGSYLDQFAIRHNVPRRPLQLDGGSGTDGRLSAPTTRVFLLPAALFLTRRSPHNGQLRQVLADAWAEHNLTAAIANPAQHPYVRLAAALADASVDGACHLFLALPTAWHPLITWIEQLLEESLGKGGKGIVIFPPQPLAPAALSGPGTLSVATGSGAGALTLPALPTPGQTSATHCLTALVVSFLGWQVTMALYGYAHGITFAGQPAVENYKTRARQLRATPDPLAVRAESALLRQQGVLTLLVPPALSHLTGTPAQVIAQAIQTQGAPLSYLDVTINGDHPDHHHLGLPALTSLCHQALGVPLKLRRAPADYHSTEQSEMDGPAGLVSLRLLTLPSQPCRLGTYTPAFLHAQAVSTWQAMAEVGRPCFLLLLEGTTDERHTALAGLWHDIAALLQV